MSKRQMSKGQMSKEQMSKEQMVKLKKCIDKSPSVRHILNFLKLSKTAKKLIPLLHNPKYLDFAIKKNEKYKEKKGIKPSETSKPSETKDKDLESRVKNLEKQYHQTQKRKDRDGDTHKEEPKSKKKKSVSCGCCGKEGKRRETCGKSSEHPCDTCKVKTKKTKKTTTIILSDDSDDDNGGPAEEYETYNKSDDDNGGPAEESEAYNSDDVSEVYYSDDESDDEDDYEDEYEYDDISSDTEYRPKSLPTSDYGRRRNKRKSKTIAKTQIRRNSVELNKDES